MKDRERKRVDKGRGETEIEGRMNGGQRGNTQTGR